MMAPVRLQLSRRKGFDLQAVSLATNGLPAVNCSRPGKWGNRYEIKRWAEHFGERVFVKDAAHAVALDREYVEHWIQRHPAMFAELRGKNLACWCGAAGPCHVDIRLELANL